MVCVMNRDDMIALLGPRPFEKEDPFDEAMLGTGAASTAPPSAAPLPVAPGAIGDLPQVGGSITDGDPVTAVKKAEKLE